MKKLRVTVEGKAYEVVVELLDEPTHSAPSAGPAVNGGPSVPPAAPPAATAAPVAAAPAPAPAANAGGGGDVPSPLAGKVVSIDVKVGDAVAEGAQIATLEAMKMNTYIFAPKAGRVQAIFVKPGDGVDEGAALLRVA